MPREVRVLVVEDNPHVARLIRDGLTGAARRQGGRVAFHFQVAADGQAALDALARGPVDLIFCDVYMPVMDGATFLTQLRARGSPRVPVVALSAGGAAAREAALQAGADAYLDKPIRLNDLLQAADRLLAAR